jgi:hypothetical protein
VIRQLAFARDGTQLLSGDEAGRVIVWDADVESWRRTACRIAAPEAGSTGCAR